ncbi:DUF6274 family protein [Streptomyces griseoruber]|uniref:Uncharacterized protein n=1 Tax=Streptomyces griseoruber TaxID=1943 RepID=A0A117RBI0_9ACTN|nr:DUF6274 family protein [Streptomyces griseoruber]KUN81656.1 hypothetical protein AQJ64_20805 [Streptomyces griseoruber]
MAASARHETRALLRAHLSAASSYGHLTRHCPICHRLLRLAMDGAPRGVQAPAGGLEEVLEEAFEDALEDGSSSTA